MDLEVNYLPGQGVAGISERARERAEKASLRNLLAEEEYEPCAKGKALKQSQRGLVLVGGVHRASRLLR